MVDKKIKIPSGLTIFLLFGIAILFVSIIFFTFEALLIIGIIYLLTIPISFVLHKKTNKVLNANKEEDHEDVL